MKMMRRTSKREDRNREFSKRACLAFALLFLFLGQNLFAAIFGLLLVVVSNRTWFGVITNPDEIFYILLYLSAKTPQIPTRITEKQRFCYEKLTKVSRSFSAVILNLNEELREPICLFYLVCRALDTIEDDMKPSVTAKIEQLRKFYTHLLSPGWKLKGYGDKKDEIELLENFDQVIHCLQNIQPKYFKVISDVANEMGNGMADFLQKKVITMDDYNLYCWYVAGLVGEGLSRLFAVSNLEDPLFANQKKLYTSMGLFLQKTNITRDYLEDIQENPPRVFYPKAIWSKYVNDVADLKDPKFIQGATKCLNEMVTDAMSCAADCLDYLHMIKDPSVFKFCAIPQVMAIATLYECYNNPDVFRKEVKIRKPLAVKMIMESHTFKTVLQFFKLYTTRLRLEIPADDPNKDRLVGILTDLDQKIHSYQLL